VAIPGSVARRLAVFGALPYAEEMRRCLRARPPLEALPEPDEPPTETLRIPAAPGAPTDC